jgi:signal transduction histidine kinase
MADSPTAHRRNVWEQWDWIWHVSAFAFLGLTVLLFLGNAPPHSLPLPFLILSALLALWYLPFIANPIVRWWSVPARCVLYFLLGWALWAGLLILDAGSLLIAGMFYPMIFTRLRTRWAIAAAFFQTLAFYVLFVLLYSPENWIITLMIGAGILAAATIIGVFMAALIGQSMERQRLLDEFTRTRASLLKAEREMGVLAERQRLAREIHDTLAQQFTSIITHLSAARLGDPAEIPARMRQAEQTAREGLDEARRIVWDRRPEPPGRASLVESAEGAAARWSVENAVPVNLAVTGNPRPLDPAVELALLRISREALHNIKKHAQARNVVVTLSYMPDSITLDVADDGRGFSPAPDGRGFGLKSMRERAEELGGALTVESGPGKGTKIAVSIPLRETP